MKNEVVSLGEYIRRLRRSAHLSLHSLAENTGISYSHLSRIENDSTIPGAQTIATLAEALDGDLKFMLEKAEALPRSILDRIVSQTSGGATALRRAAHQSPREDSSSTSSSNAIFEFARLQGLTDDDAREVAQAMLQLIHLTEDKRAAITLLIQSVAKEGDEHAG